MSNVNISNPEPEHHKHHNILQHHHHLSPPHHMSESVAQSSDFLNLTEPPQASKTPDPALLFPLRRRSSSNYQTALLSNKLKASLQTYQHHQQEQQEHQHNDHPVTVKDANIPSIPVPAASHAKQTAPKESLTPTWSAELSKRSLQHGSIDLSHVSDHDQGIFNVQYNKTSPHHHKNALKEEVDPLNEDQRTLERSKSGESLNYHSNQIENPIIPYSPPVNIPSDSIDEDLSNSNQGFEYDKFKRMSMQYDY